MRVKYYVLFIGVAGVIGALSQSLGSAGFGGGSMASVERKCTRMMTGSGYTDASSKAVCSCLVDNASKWRDRNPDAEYTEEIHTNFATVCVNTVGLAHRPGYGGAASGGYAQQSDWGGQGFAAEEGEWAD